MTSRNSQYFSQRQWAQRRRAYQTMLEAQYFTAELVAGLSEPSAPEGAVCDFCSGAIVGGICDTCEAVFVDGVCQPKFRQVEKL